MPHKLIMLLLMITICFTITSCGDSKERELMDMDNYIRQYSVNATTVKIDFGTEQSQQTTQKQGEKSTTAKSVPSDISITKSTKPTAKPTQKATQKATQKSQPKATQKPTAKPTQKATQKATQKQTSKVTQQPRTYKLGDVNRDGCVTAVDLTVLRNRLNLGRSMSDIMDVADMDGNGKVNQKDLELLVKEMAKHSG